MKRSIPIGAVDTIPQYEQGQAVGQTWGPSVMQWSAGASWPVFEAQPSDKMHIPFCLNLGVDVWHVPLADAMKRVDFQSSGRVAYVDEDNE